MDFAFTQEQEMLRDGLGKFLEKSYDFDARQKLITSDEPWSNKAWQQFAEFGLFALPFAEEQGGLGGSVSDCVALAELLGKHLTVEPFTSSTMLVGACLAASEDEAAQNWLGKIIAGEAVGAFAHEEGRGIANLNQIAVRAEARDDGFALTGDKTLVIAGAEADVLIVTARMGDGKIGLFAIDPAGDGIDMRPYRMIDGYRAANVRFGAAWVAGNSLLVADAAEILQPIISNTIIAQSAEAVGAMGALVAITGEYAATRKQFGVPIGSFQSIAHRLADMKIAYTKARASMIYTTALAESGACTPRDVSVLKGLIGKSGREIGESAIQIHGGVGMTDELSVSHYHKRLIALDSQFGSHGYHLRMVGMPG